MKYSFTPLLIMMVFTSACTGTQTTVNETWILAELISRGERTDVVTEIVEVRNCGVPQPKTTYCSAGTSNNLSISFGGGVQFGEGIVGVINSEVMAGLGMGKESGESIELILPPSDSIYQYTIVKTYHVIAGKVLVRSSSGKEQEAEFAFHASCSMSIQDAPESLKCDKGALSPAITDTVNEGPIFTNQPINQPYQLDKAKVIVNRSTTYDLENIISIWDANNLALGDILQPGAKSFNISANKENVWRWVWYWCAIGNNILQENLKHISVTFSVDDQYLPKNLIVEYEEPTTTGWDCHYWSSTLSDWQPGTFIKLFINFNFSEEIYDGRINYPPGDYSIPIYVSVK